MYDRVLNQWLTDYYRGHRIEFEGPQDGPLFVVIHLMSIEAGFPQVRGKTPYSRYDDAVKAGRAALDKLLDRG